MQSEAGHSLLGVVPAWVGLAKISVIRIYDCRPCGRYFTAIFHGIAQPATYNGHQIIYPPQAAADGCIKGQWTGIFGFIAKQHMRVAAQKHCHAITRVIRLQAKLKRWKT